MQTKILSLDELEEAVFILQNSGIVAFPTETVYGLGANLFDERAIEQIFAVKGRPTDNPLIAHISDLSQVDQIVQETNDDFYLLAKAFWPGPLTIVMPKHPLVPKIATAGLETIGIRMPDHLLARALIAKVNKPLVAPSANLSGRPSPTEVAHVLEDLSGLIPAILDGSRCDIGIESTVVSLVHGTPTILRPGKITALEIERILNKAVAAEEASSETPLCPGMKYRHYAPKARVQLFFSSGDLEDALAKSQESILILGSPLSPFQHLENFHLCTQFDIYAALRMADAKQYTEVFIDCDRDLQMDVALMNRIRKASFS